MVVLTTLLALALAPGGVGRLLDEGTYVIVNRASGRRIFSGPSGFAATAGGPDRTIFQEHRWRLVLHSNETYVIENYANGMRIFAQTGKDYSEGFLTTDQGPVYQDQTWMPLPQSDGSHALVNARSGRVMAASVGLEGAAGFSAVRASSMDTLAADQAWWLVDPDHGGGFAELSKLTAEISELQSRLNEEQATSAALVKRHALEAARASDAEAALRAGLSGCSHAMWGQNPAAAVFAVFAAVALASICGLRCCTRKEAAAPGRENDTMLAPEIAHRVFCSESGGLATRIVRIQCPGVDHSGIEVNLICDGCDVTISREASLGVQALSWKKRFRFEPVDGPFEFREDRMQLEHGFLQLVFQARSFQSRTVRFPQHYSLAATDGDLLWEADTSTSVGSFDVEAVPSSPARSRDGKEGSDIGTTEPPSPSLELPRRRYFPVGGA
eukprot:gb/GFBE01047585.1/.p1 GENE.gb/GFBE01047585.1/~~gb/GFBE01047585.1/.p1  ORF type:complete len:441 (+),score=68.54 gb/GFBE01047585.1/:1-1323(+)